MRARPGNPRRWATLMLAAVTVLPLASVRTESTTLENLSSGDARVFDTVDPSAYRLDFPMLPPEDPLSALPKGFPIDSTIRNDAQSLFETVTRTGVPLPESTPGDYDPEAVFLPANPFNEVPPLGVIDYPVTQEREIILLDRGHPVFYEIGKTTEQFMMRESEVSLIMPDIPEPSLVFAKQRRNLRTAGPFRYAMDFFQSVAFNDNVFGASTGQQSDVFYTFNPRLYVETGTRGLAALSYSPSFVFYNRYKEMNAANENINLTLRYPFTKLQIGADFGYQTQTGVFVNSTGIAKQQTFTANAFARYPFTAKSEGLLSYLGSVSDNDPGGQRTDHRGVLAWDYQFSSRLAGGAFIEYGQSGAPIGTQNYQSLGLQWLYRPDYHWRFMGRLGYQTRQLQPGVADLNAFNAPIFDVTAAYHLTHRLGALLRVYREINTDAFESVSLQMRTAVAAKLLVRFYEKTDLTLRAEVGHIDQWGDGEMERSNLDYLEGGLTLSYALTRTVELIFFDTLQKRFAASDEDSYTSNTIGLAINLRF